MFLHYVNIYILRNRFVAEILRKYRSEKIVKYLRNEESKLEIILSHPIELIEFFIKSQNLFLLLMHYRNLSCEKFNFNHTLPPYRDIESTISFLHSIYSYSYIYAYKECFLIPISYGDTRADISRSSDLEIMCDNNLVMNEYQEANHISAISTRYIG